MTIKKTEKKIYYLEKLPKAERSFYYNLLIALGYTSYSAQRIRDFRHTNIKKVLHATIENGKPLINL